ncbi:P-loop containing nucleoside triphosphate hydrolase protein [Tuber magnatum]|uniref:P-loop containing nucleoside triphosphate hydrolase protein n=1 Tax=Tuber magnatum TaxID=42249 RepID=A0A317ST80_9PEZI|nr:P-loop containing nucleoside triphosphate hydrolase protein [Tuber magnatum]
MDLCKDCEVHKSRPKRMSDVELAKFIRAVPCEFCISNISFNRGPNRESEGKPTGVQRHSFRPSTEPDAFEHLLGEPLGPWKIILSQQAMEDLEEANRHGDLESVRCKFSELASGDWAGEETLHRAEWGNELSYQVPLFKTFYNSTYFILWQIDAAFDERFSKDYQVIKVWAIGEPENLDSIVVYIHRTQQAYTKTRVEACERDDLDGSWGIRLPVRAYLDSEKSGVMGVDDSCNEDFGNSAQLAKFYSLTITVLDNIASATGKVAYPLAISVDEARVVDHFATPAFILGRSGTGKTTCLVYKLAGRYLSSRGNEAPLRQVLLTRSKRLVSKLRANTDGLIEARSGNGERASEGTCAKKDDFDDNTKRQFSSLADTDFPLICTFDYLLRLIENSIREQENKQIYMKIDSFTCARVINFRRFSIEYWEHLSPKLKKRIPVDLAFLEIMGVIKGSVSQATSFEPLSRQDYLGKRWRLAPNFATEQERGAVYDIYEWYERAKKKRGDIDQADRIIKVTKALEAFRSSGISEDNVFEQNTRRILHEIYVDAGDTAQCISKDALFRFANAKALFYERFEDSTSSTRDLKPTLLPLSHNFRSHKQILRVASLVMDLLYRGFPELVDELPPEVGDIPGPKPVLYIGSNTTDVLKLLEKMETPRESDARSGKFHEYGEVRVILVRDEETRDNLRTELGKSSLVLTILQSKGMEFEDVFLYDFLSTSPYSDRLYILEELFKRSHHTVFGGEGESGRGGKHEGGVRSRDGKGTSASRVSHVAWAKENIVLCSELKNLYVGVTRARNKLCLLESNANILNPVERLFNQTASLLLPGKYPRPILKILTEQNTGALRCFENAECPHGMTLANAYITEEIGLAKRARRLLKVAKVYFIQASELFLQAGSIAKAVQCRKEGGDLKGAAKILAVSGAYQDAAWLAAEAGLFSEASGIYSKLKKHGKALAGFESEIEPCCRKQYVQFLTAFWKRNGPGVLEKMKERRRYLAPRYKYSKNCCLLADMKAHKNWTY